MHYVPLVRWLLLLTVLYAASVPIAAVVWPRLPDRGAAFALPLALVTIGVSAVWLGQLRFGPGVAALAVLLPIVVGAIAFRRGAHPTLHRVGPPYAIFLAGFVAMLLFRMASPTITPQAGEQFLHFAVLNAVERAPVLPPEDMWFAGEPIRYYYGGHVTTVSLALVAGVETRIAYNLALATYFGVLVAGAYGLAGAVAARAEIDRAPGDPLDGRRYHLGGALGAFFVAFAGMVTTPVRLAFGFLSTETALRYGEDVFGAIRYGDTAEMLAQQSSPSTWSWWYERQVVPGTLQEVPLYSFVKGDHHGHTITTGFLLLAAALAYAYYLTPADARRRRVAILLGALPLVGGFLGLTNTWALPSVPGIAWLALLTAAAHPATLLPDRIVARARRWVPEGARRGIPDVGSPALRSEASRVALGTAFAGVVAGLSLLVAAPFVFGGTPTNDGIGLFPPRSNLVGFLLLWAGPFALFAAYLATRDVDVASRSTARTTVASGGTALLAAAYVLGPGEFPTLALTAPLLVGGYVVARVADDAGFEATLLLAGVGLVLAMELVHAKVWPPGMVRWNTTLKVAIQAWTFVGVAAGIVTTRLLTAGWGGLRDVERDSVVPVRSTVLLVIVVAIVLASAVFPAMVIANEWAGAYDDPTIDGVAPTEDREPDRMAAIAWLDDREGTPVVLEAPTRRSYSWGSMASTYTGLPTVVGWDHQRGYRGDEAFERRAAHADRMYEGPRAVAVALLDAYDVEYVWVGERERERYDDLRAFDDIEGVDVAFENDAVTIYRIDQEAVPESPVDFEALTAGGPGLEIATWDVREGSDGEVVVEATVTNTVEHDSTSSPPESGDETVSERSGVVVASAATDESKETDSETVTLAPGEEAVVEIRLGLSYERFLADGEATVDVYG